jgi:hypothetical protein
MSKFIRGLGSFIQIAGGLLGFVLSLLFLYSEFGGGAVIVGLFIFPATLGLLPLYALFVYGAWNLLLINYGSIAAGWVLHKIADGMDEQPDGPTAEALTSEIQVPLVRPTDPVPTTAPRAIPAQEPTVEAPKNNSAAVWFFLIIGGLFLFAIFSSQANSSSTPPRPTNTPRPTFAPPTRTPLPRATNTPIPVSLRACVTNSTARIRKGPGTEYEVIGGMVSGTCMRITGQDGNSTWVYMTSEDNKTGWVATSLLTIEGDLSWVPIGTGSHALSLVPTSKLRPTPTRKPLVFATNTPQPLVIQPTANNANCSPAYPGVCIPPRPPDLDCKDIPYRRFTVLSPDPHGFDRDQDGIGCES